MQLQWLGFYYLLEFSVFDKETKGHRDYCVLHQRSRQRMPRSWMLFLYGERSFFPTDGNGNILLRITSSLHTWKVGSSIWNQLSRSFPEFITTEAHWAALHPIWSMVKPEASPRDGGLPEATFFAWSKCPLSSCFTWGHIWSIFAFRNIQNEFLAVFK